MKPRSWYSMPSSWTREILYVEQRLRCAWPLATPAWSVCSMTPLPRSFTSMRSTERSVSVFQSIMSMTSVSGHHLGSFTVAKYTEICVHFLPACDRDTGMEAGNVLDDYITASSYLTLSYPGRARLNAQYGEWNADDLLRCRCWKSFDVVVLSPDNYRVVLRKCALGIIRVNCLRLVYFTALCSNKANGVIVSVLF